MKEYMKYILTLYINKEGVIHEIVEIKVRKNGIILIFN